MQRNPESARERREREIEREREWERIKMWNWFSAERSWARPVFALFSPLKALFSFSGFCLFYFFPPVTHTHTPTHTHTHTLTHTHSHTHSHTSITKTRKIRQRVEISNRKRDEPSLSASPVLADYHKTSTNLFISGQHPSGTVWNTELFFFFSSSNPSCPLLFPFVGHKKGLLQLPQRLI